MINKILTDTEKQDMILKFLRLNKREFAESLGVNVQVIYSLNGKKSTNFTPEVLSGIAKKFPEISLHWLLTGEGDITNSEISNSVIVNQHDGNNATINSDSELSKVVDYQQETIRKYQEQVSRQQEQIDKLLGLIK